MRLSFQFFGRTVETSKRRFKAGNCLDQTQNRIDLAHIEQKTAGAFRPGRSIAMENPKYQSG